MKLTRPGKRIYDHLVRAYDAELQGLIVKGGGHMIGSGSHFTLCTEYWIGLLYRIFY